MHYSTQCHTTFLTDNCILVLSIYLTRKAVHQSTCCSYTWHSFLDILFLVKEVKRYRFPHFKANAHLDSLPHFRNILWHCLHYNKAILIRLKQFWWSLVTLDHDKRFFQQIEVWFKFKMETTFCEDWNTCLSILQ